MRFRLCCAAVVLVAGSAAFAAEPADVQPIPPERREEIRRDRPVRARAKRAVSLAAAEAASKAAGQDDFDVLSYALDLSFDPTARTVSGTATITARSLVPSLTHVALDLADGMTVTSVTRGGAPLVFAHAAGTATLDVTLDRAFAAGQDVALVVAYGGSPDLSSASFGWNRYSSNGGDGQMVWSLSEPYGAREWWPCKDVPGDKATVEEWWTTPAAWTATGNGVLVGVEDVAGGRKRYHWRPSHPLATYLVSIAATGYVSWSDNYTTLDDRAMPVTHYVYDDSGALARGMESFSRTPAMIAAYARAFGEYPFSEDKYGMSAFPWSGGMEHTTNTSYGYMLIDGSHRYDDIVAHELAHQWWGDSVSPATWKDVWLNEGFASWSEALWAETNGGASAYRNYIKSAFTYQALGGPLYDPGTTMDELFSSMVYNRGAYVVHMLRGVLGDGPFFAAMRDWYREHRDGAATTAQFQATMERRYGASLQWFFDEWVYRAGAPTYQYGFLAVNEGATYRTYVHVKQTQTAYGAFTMPLGLTLVSAAGRDARAVRNDAADQWFEFAAPQATTSVAFDENGWILKSSASSVTVADADGDGLPDELDCAPSDKTHGRPSEVFQLTAKKVGTSGTILSWTAAPRAGSYGVQRGLASQLGQGNFGSCLKSGVTALSSNDATVPPAGEAFFYLVTGKDAGCGGAGSAGATSAGAARPAACL